MTYPPAPINGIMVTGFMTPPGAKNFTYPPSLSEQLLQRGYKVEQIFEHKRRPTLDDVRQRIENHTDIAKWLMETQDWDFFMVVYMASDGVVHRFPGNPKMIRYVYELLDETVAALMDAAPDNTITLLVSDRGIGVVHRHFMLNNWLLNHGYIKLRKKRR